jgi:integrase
VGDNEEDGSEREGVTEGWPGKPIFDESLAQAMLEAGRRLSPRHWALVKILLRTGMELTALGRITWRDVYPDKVFWKPSRTKQVAVIPIEDEDLALAFRIFVTGQRKESGMLDYWIEQTAKETREPAALNITALSLRLTYCYRRLLEGDDPDDVARRTRMARPLIHRVIVEMEARDLMPLVLHGADVAPAPGPDEAE